MVDQVKSENELCEWWCEFRRKYLPKVLEKLVEIPIIGWIIAGLFWLLALILSAICGCPLKGEADESVQAERAAAESLGLTANDLCKAWKAVRPYWGQIVEAARKVSPHAAELLERIGKELDRRCP